MFSPAILPTSRAPFLRFGLVLPDLLLSVFVWLSGTLEESTSGARILDRVLARNRGVDFNREARLAFWSSRNKLAFCLSYEGYSRRRNLAMSYYSITYGWCIRPPRVYLLFLHDILRVFLLKIAQWEYRWPEKRTQNRTLKRFLCTQPVTFPNENCNFEGMMSIRYGA